MSATEHNASLSLQQALALLPDLARAGRHEQARQVLDELLRHVAVLHTTEPSAADQLQQQLRPWQLRLAAWWWQPLGAGPVWLRRTQADDAAFWSAAYKDASFARRFNRQQPWKGDLARALQRAGELPPLDQGALHWVVCDGAGQRLGLASLTSLNQANARAEFSIGFPSAAGSMHGVLASLWVFHFAFFVLRLNKLTTYVYADNPEARHNSLRLGLREEGLLKEHFLLPPGEYVDVLAMGLTRSQLQADQRLVSLAKRRIGQVWSNNAAGDGAAAPCASSST